VNDLDKLRSGLGGWGANVRKEEKQRESRKQPRGGEEIRSPSGTKWIQKEGHRMELEGALLAQPSIVGHRPNPPKKNRHNNHKNEKTAHTGGDFQGRGVRTAERAGGRERGGQ